MKTALRTALARDGIVRLLARKRSNGADASLDRQIAAVLELQRLTRLPALESMPPARARRFAEDGLALLDLDAIAMVELVDLSVGEIPVRIYVPPHAGDDWIVYFHGGGGVIGSIRDKEPVTRYLAAHTRCTVASVGYRLGPEHKHPAAIEDAIAAYRALVARVPFDGRIAVAGDSFGGFLSAHVDRAARAAAERAPDLQVLIYPVVDWTMSQASIDRFASGYMLTKAMMLWFREHYLRDEADRRACSPLFWDDIADSAPAIVITAGYDPLVDEGNAWAERLRAAGVPVRHRFHPSLVHGFLSFAGAVRAARDATDRLCADIVDLLAP
jgi:acetyl esterase